MKKNIAITIGDPQGIGPEIIAKTLKDKRVLSLCAPVLIGDISALKKFGLKTENFPSINTGPGALGSFKAVRVATNLALSGVVGAVVTAPISKENWFKAGVKYTAHTEYFKEYASENGSALMMFTSGKLNCALVTEHVSIKELPSKITKEKIVEAGRLFKKVLGKNARIAVSALNPHAGDGGKLGTEEKEIILPAAKKLKMDGPLPIDSLWLKHKKGIYDGILCMYHDEALLGLKLAATEPIIHITAGLKFLRTSPTHGTAFDIAGKNKADNTGLKAALLYACKHI